MGKYSADFTAYATTTSPKTAIAVVAGASELSEIIEAVVTGSGTATAADRMHSASGHFYDGTGGGTGTGVTPELLSQRNAAALMTTTIEFSGEPTTYNTVGVLRFGFNQRGGMRWAVPRGEGIIVLGGQTEDNFGVRLDSDAAGEVEGYVHFHEP